MKKVKIHTLTILGIFSCFTFFSCYKSTINMIQMPDNSFSISQTEITQEQYTAIMKENPSHNIGTNLPVDSVSWFDAVYFCNKLSLKEGREPVYMVNGTTDVSKWKYNPHQGEWIQDKVIMNEHANGYRLPTSSEFEFASKGGENYKYSGSNMLSEVGWYAANSDTKPHEVATKKANGYGLYDMSGNISEWCWNASGRQKLYRGGSWLDSSMYHQCHFDCLIYYPNYQWEIIGFRVAYSN